MNPNFARVVYCGLKIPTIYGSTRSFLLTVGSTTPSSVVAVFSHIWRGFLRLVTTTLAKSGLNLLLSLLMIASSLAAFTPREVLIRGVPERLRGEFAPLLDVTPGSDASPEAIRESIRLLMATGLLDDVKVLKEGDDLIFEVTPKRFVRKIRVSGARSSDVRKIAGLERGTWHSREDLEKEIPEKIRSSWCRRGYGRVKVEVQVQEIQPRPDVAVSVRVSTGPLLPIDRVVIRGNTPEGLREPFTALRGRVVSQRSIEKLVKGFEKTLRHAGYLQSNVNLVRSGFENGERVVVIALESGRRCVVEFKGDRVTRSLRKKVKRMIKSRGLDEAALNAILRDYRMRLERKGYARASVKHAVVEDEKSGVVHLVIFAYRGNPYYLAHLEFNGNKLFTDRELADFLGWTIGKKITAAAIGSGRDALEQLYVTRGYMDVAVAKPEIAYNKRGGPIDVTFTIMEGEPFIVDDVTVEELPDALKNLMNPLSFAPGDPMQESLAARDINALRSLLLDHGYPDADVKFVSREDDHHLHVIYRCHPGVPHTFGRVILRNLTGVYPSALKHEILIKEGAPFSRKVLTGTQERLYSTGIFKEVEVTRVVSQLEPTRDNVIIGLHEDKPYTLLYGAGYDTEDNVRIQLGFTASNLFHRRHSLGFTTRWSSRENYFRTTYTIPYTLGTPFPTSFVAYGTKEKWDWFDLYRRSFYVEYRRDWGPLSHGYFRIQGDLEDPDSLDAYLDPRLGRKRTVTGPVLSYVYDSRPNPIFPLSGSFFSAELKSALALPWTDTHFFRWFLHGSVYLPFSSATTLVFSTRYGGINPLGGATIPLGDRFFSGGRTSLRAFARDTLGIEGVTLIDGKPLGGNGLLLGNLEIRTLVSKSIGFSVFLESGNVFRNYDDVDIGKLRYGTGIGFFVLTPVGPIRLDYGYKLNPEEGESSDQWFMSLGFPF